MPPKKNKKQPKNAFYYYMLEYQRSGPQRHFPGGLREVADAAGASWKHLSAEQKRPYEDMATREKGRSGNHDKYTTQGQSYAELDMEQKEARDKVALMKKTIIDTLISLGRNTGLATAPWFFIHINYFVKRDEGTYFAAEFALAKYSIKDGVHPKIYSCMVDPGDLPTGYSYKAKLHSEETHKCPLPPKVLPGAKKSVEIVNSMEAFIREHVGASDDPLPPLYTLITCIEPVANILGQWAVEKGERANFYRVFPLEQLFIDMKNFGLKPEGERLFIGGVQDDGFAHISQAELALNNDMYSFTLNISCAYHEEQDVMCHCSKSFVRRWGWIISNHVCRNLDVQMRPAAHCPKDVVPESLLMSAHTTRNIDGLTGIPPAEPIKTRAAGRGIPITRESSSAAAPRRPIVPQPTNAWTTARQPLTNNASLNQFEEASAPQRQSRFAAYDDGVPLRQPKSSSLALEIGKVAPGGTFTAEDFPAIGRLNISSGAGRGNRLANIPPPPASDSDDSDSSAPVGRGGWNAVGGRGGKRGSFD